MNRKEIFDNKRPTMTPVEMVEAERAGRTIDSFDLRPIVDKEPDIRAVAVKLAFTEGAPLTVILDRFAAKRLLLLLGAHELGDWRATPILPPGQVLQ